MKKLSGAQKRHNRYGKDSYKVIKSKLKAYGRNSFGHDEEARLAAGQAIRDALKQGQKVGT